MLKCFSSRRIGVLFIFWLWVFCVLTPGEGVGEVVASWAGGQLTSEEMAFYSQALQYPYRDPIETMRTSRDEAERRDAAYFVRLIAKERAWEHEYARRARELCPSMESTVTLLTKPVFNSCVAQMWQAKVAQEFTTPPLEKVVEAGLTKYRSRFERDELREVRYIFRSTTGTRTQEEREQVRREAEEVYRLLVEHRLRFDDAAKLYSEVPSSARGGRLGVISRRAGFNPRFMDFVFSLPKNEVSSPTLLHNGYYIAEVTQIYPEIRLTTDTITSSPIIQDQIRGLLREEFLASKLKDLVGPNVAQTSITDELVARAALEKMTTPTECEIKERFLRERILARTCFLDTNRERFRPTEDDARAYYTSYTQAMRKGGYLKFTRFFVPYGTARYPTRKAAQDTITSFRLELMNHPEWTLEQLRQEGAKFDVEVSQSEDWEMTTNEPKADDELVRITTGSMTSNVYTEKGVAFFRLDGRRERPRLTFDEVRDFCFEQARNRKAWEALQESVETYARQQGLKFHVPLADEEAQSAENK